METKYEWKYEDHGDHETWTCDGAMFVLEVTLNGDDEVVTGELMAEVPATFWEPADLKTIHSAQYESSGAARADLEALDREALANEERFEAEVTRSLEAQAAAEGNLG
jgi:hypothetical protein